MATEKFSKTEFEAALPRHNRTGAALWQSLGMLNGEYTYLIPVTEYAAIMIRSSVDASGYAASSGEDSIRMWLVNPDTTTGYAPVGCKVDSFTKRTKNWRSTMLDKLRIQFRLAKFVHPCACGGMVHVAKAGKHTSKPGYIFTSCSHSYKNAPCEHTRFTWIADPNFNLF